jgi:hypothetical protein
MAMTRQGQREVGGQEVERLLRALAEGLPGQLDALARALLRAAGFMTEPLRLAVAGQIKRGKSTLVNGLLGEAVAPTGRLELTFNVNELAYHETPRLVAHYKDGDVEVLPWDDLELLTVRDSAMLGRLIRIRKLELGVPNQLLRQFRLVDTPGLASVHGVDSANSAAYLGITDPGERKGADEVLTAIGRDAAAIHDASIKEVGEADAVLMMFSRAVSAADLQVVDDFCSTIADGTGAELSPLRAFGVLSRCDEFWPPEPGTDPLTYHPMIDAAQRIVDNWMRDPRVKRRFYVIKPVAGLVALGATTASPEMFGALREISATERWAQTVVRHMCDVKAFTGPPSTSLPVPVELRTQMVDELGLWGIFRACTHLRENVGIADADVRQLLLVDSGVLALRELITSHFGNRASLIKLDRGLKDVDAAVGACRVAALGAGLKPPAEVDHVASEVERLRLEMHGFSELAALAAYYDGDLPSEWRADLLSVTGEHGRSVAARLGLADSDPFAALRNVVDDKVELWRARAGDQLGTGAAQAARTVAQSYERLGERIGSAQALLADTGL